MWDLLWGSTGLSVLTWKEVIMLGVSLVVLYLGIVKKYEPLLLIPIGFGIWLGNFPQSEIMGEQGLLGILYQGIWLYPSLIFFGIGALTDFGPLIANPRSLLLGAAAQIGIFGTFIGARPKWEPLWALC